MLFAFIVYFEWLLLDRPNYKYTIFYSCHVEVLLHDLNMWLWLLDTYHLGTVISKIVHHGTLRFGMGVFAELGSIQ